VEELYRRIVEEVAAYVAERGTLEKEKYNELYRRFRKQYPLPAQLIQQAINQGVETGKSFLELKRSGRIRRPRPEVRWLQEGCRLRGSRMAGAVSPRREERGLDCEEC
jgi:putative transposase